MRFGVTIYTYILYDIHIYIYWLYRSKNLYTQGNTGAVYRGFAGAL